MARSASRRENKQRGLPEMRQESVVKPDLFELQVDMNRFAYENYARIDSDHLWDDLFTNPDLYNPEVESKNDGWTIDGLLDVLENPIVPSPIVMLGWFELLEQTELPTNSIHWTVVSNQILEVMHALGVYPELHTVRVLERSQFNNPYGLNLRFYEDNANVKGMIYKDDWFYGIRLPRYTVIANHWNSRDKKNVPWLEQFENCPAFFCDPKSPGRIFLLPVARIALEQAEIRGIRFTEPFQ
jgi:hypothetical protein